MSRRAARDRRRALLTGLAFLSPNILGVAVFTVFPVVFSLVMAFSNWDLTQHNPFKDTRPKFEGLGNFAELVRGWEFLRYFGNTLFFMMGIPVAVAGSLGAAILLSKDTRAGGGRPYVWLLASAGLIAGCVMLALAGTGQTAMVLLIAGAGCGILLLGVTGGLTFYRTLFYTPHFVAGVATFILWKKLYAQQTGPINVALQPVLDGVAGAAQAVGPFFTALAWLGVVLLLLLLAMGLRRLRQVYIDGELGWRAALLPVVLLLVPFGVAMMWGYASPYRAVLLVGGVAVVLYHATRLVRSADKFSAPSATEGFGSALMLALLTMVGQFVVLGLLVVAGNVPSMAGDGVLEAPSWLTDPAFAKPALMIMGFWAAIGSNNMLLYLAALTNVPGELYEAADIDGARPMQRFWNITWPQLAPTTFFIFVMSTIGGLQGGFEMARVMTEGGPAGATTTLSYFIYIEGFETGRLGFASAVSWALFVLVFSVTLFNWKFGNRYVND